MSVPVGKTLRVGSVVFLAVDMNVGEGIVEAMGEDRLVALMDVLD